MTDPIHIVASTDENYAPHLGVMFASLLANTQGPERVRLYVIDGGINADTRAKLDEVVERFGARLDFFTLADEAYADYPLEKFLTAPAYYRLSIPELFDNDVNKVLYLDCDLIVRSDVQELWDAPLDSCALAAVENISNTTYKRSGVPQSSYFNSGVMLLNLAVWRDDNIAAQVRDVVTKPGSTTKNDQCALNIVLHDRWKRLPLKWNFQSGMYRPHHQLDKYAEKEVSEALREPAIIHYVGWSKPWLYLCYHPLAHEYLQYRSQTKWADVPLEGDTLRNRVRKYIRPSLLKKLYRQRKWQAFYRRSADRGR